LIQAVSIQNISSLALILCYLKKGGESWLFIYKILAIFWPLLLDKNLVGNILGINMRSLFAKFQPSSFKTEGGDRGKWMNWTVKMQNFHNGTKILLLIFNKLPLTQLKINVTDVNCLSLIKKIRMDAKKWISIVICGFFLPCRPYFLEE